MWSFSLTCPLECKPGTYGARCEKKCACPPGVSCDHVTGECRRKCPPGLHGENCDQGSSVCADISFSACLLVLDSETVLSCVSSS